ncbi:DsbA family protein [Mucilaginibacter aquatilis]|uniref:DsbA family protein n=1 Tax=Mucilaginibacter aquatilis TaxID=1517760 RepID=A0A6I4IQ04_9SPHI|nr:DsbA family protein [Mucilaginibacter aquatilis]MVN90903.1 DsbA family protein [Mucilaginibacter aquatilis]
MTTSADSNPLLCDIETGICEIPAQENNAQTTTIENGNKPLKLLYFTDPICSSCWGIEPQLRKLKLEYGHVVEVEYHMGGLLPDWSYNSGGISKPSDVAHHWDEVSLHYDMPIDGDVWLEDPLDSSYPPSIAFKAAQLQDNTKAVAMLRIMREMVFLQKKNITKWEIIEQAGNLAGLELNKLRDDFNNAAKLSFQQDLDLAQSLGVKGFPTIFFNDALGNSERVYGSKPYDVYQTAIKKLASQSAKFTYAKDWQSLFSIYPTMTTREFAELSEISKTYAGVILSDLLQQGLLSRYQCKNGDLWMMNGK